MTDNIITTDHPLTPAQQETLSALLDTLVPASDDGIMPSARELDFVSHLGEQAADFLPALPAVLNGFGEGFAGKPIADRVEIVKAFSTGQPEIFEALLFQTYNCYYQDDRVLTGIGSTAGPPFPRGNTVDAGNLSLLDPVVKRGKTYRK